MAPPLCRNDIWTLTPSAHQALTKFGFTNFGGQVERYICLTHRWGKSQLLKTITVTLGSHKNGIPWDMIPRTFHGAISLARDLGIDRHHSHQPRRLG